MRWMWKDMVAGKPNRQPDTVLRMDPYWFEEMVAIVDVDTGPWSRSRQLVDIAIIDGSMILVPRIDKALYPEPPPRLMEEFEMWKKRKAEEILLGV